jgi:hypothetical protein
MSRSAAPSLLLLTALLGVAGCSGSRKPDAEEEGWETLGAGQLSDSLALTTPAGIQVWFTTSRPATDSTGAPCVERALEIRQKGTKTLVPLLYTGTVPRLLNDSTIEATLWLHCQPMSLYRVNLRTARPVLVR